MAQFTSWLISIGISKDILTVLVFVPIILTVTTFSRYVTGIKTFGVYGAMILAIAYYFVGIVPGLILTIIIVFSAWTAQKTLKRVRLHYLSRLAVIYGIEIALVLIAFSLMAVLPENIRSFIFKPLSPLTLVMMISLTDRFVANYIKKGLFTAVRLTTETVVIALISCGIMILEPVRNFMVNNLWTIPITVVINFIIGKYLSIRWIELIRFNQVIRNVESSETSPGK